MVHCGHQIIYFKISESTFLFYIKNRNYVLKKQLGPNFSIPSIFFVWLLVFIYLAKSSEVIQKQSTNAGKFEKRVFNVTKSYKC